MVWRIALLVTAGAACFAQTDSQPSTPGSDLAIVSLSTPTYPPLARQANISGDVELRLGLRKDGTIESLVVMSGPPMLTQAALSSAQQSSFDCRGCQAEVTSYLLIYSFQFVASEHSALLKGN